MRIHAATPEDIPFINEVINHPLVHPRVAPCDTPLDASYSLGRLVMFVAPGDGVVFGEALGSGRYLALSAFLPHAWGAKSVLAHRQAMREMFTKTDCTRIFATIEEDHKRALRNAHGMGLQAKGFVNGRTWMEVGVLEWAMTDREMRKIGERVYAAIGRKPDAHCAVFGWFMETARNGWAGKAHAQWWTYSRLANAPEIVPINEEFDEFMYDGRWFKCGHEVTTC